MFKSFLYKFYKSIQGQMWQVVFSLLFIYSYCIRKQQRTAVQFRKYLSKNCKDYLCFDWQSP